MNKSVFFLSMLAMLGSPTSFGLNLPLELETREVKSEVSASEFYSKLGFLESGGDYSAVNTFGYIGKYQFGVATLKAIGIEVSRGEYLKDTVLQERSVRVLTAHNKKVLRRHIRKYTGTTIKGVVVSEAGILAAAHLVGAGNVMAYLESGGRINKADAYNTKCSDYMAKFASVKGIE